MEYDFSGWATKSNIRCSDGRTIAQGAFRDNDGITVPLVWMHEHQDPANVLGKARLEAREDGVYARCSLNHTEAAENCRELIKHGDITALSIFANGLSNRDNTVVHGNIREVSVVLSGANPGALIDDITIEHGEILDSDSAIIYSGESDINLTNNTKDEKMVHKDNEGVEYLKHDSGEDPNEPSKTQEDSQQGSGDDETIKDIFDTLNEKQKQVVFYLVGQALKDAGVEPEGEGSEEPSNDVEHSQEFEEEDSLMHTNLFESNGPVSSKKPVRFDKNEVREIVHDAMHSGNGSLRDAVIAHASNYGIQNIDILFPDAKNVLESPEFISRRMDWVSEVLGKTHHSPFSRIKSTAADITAPEARARGYVKGNLKKEEIIKLLKRQTTPTTIYKKQKLDRDDIVDITDLDVVAFLRAEMRIMLDEEIARAILIGDGREIDDPDKINEDNIRPILKDDDLYAYHTVASTDPSNATFVDMVTRSMEDYKGTGVPTLYTSRKFYNDMILTRGTLDNRRIYANESELVSALGVAGIVRVDLFENAYRKVDDTTNPYRIPYGILVNLSDYYVGTDKGGDVSMFDDFDIDYNQFKYLMETRMSGALVRPRSAIVIESKAATLPTVADKTASSPTPAGS